MTDKPRVAIYARTATGPNPDAIAMQIAQCKSFSNKQNWDVILTASDDGISGAHLDRPGLAEILDVVVSGSIDIVLADGTERFARDADVLGSIIATCKEQGIRCQALALNLCDSPFIEPDTASNTPAFAAATFKL